MAPSIRDYQHMKMLATFDTGHICKLLPAGVPEEVFLESVRTNLHIADADTIFHIGIIDSSERRYELYVITIKSVADYLAPVTHFRSNDKLPKSSWFFNGIHIEAMAIDFRLMSMRMSNHGLTPAAVVFEKPLYSINPSWQDRYIAVAYNNGLASTVIFECMNRGTKLEWTTGQVPDDKVFISKAQSGAGVDKRRAACIKRGKTIVEKLPLTDAFIDIVEWFHGDQIRRRT